MVAQVGYGQTVIPQFGACSSLETHGQRAIFKGMQLWPAISRLLTVLAVVGLVGGAFVAPAKAGPMTDVVVTAAMAEGMECCDPPASAPSDCRDMKACPFAVLCAVKCPQSLASSASVQIRLAVAAAIPVLDDRPSGEFASPPLGHPPKP